MIKYPKMLYKCPGPVLHNDGISYEPLIVDDADAEAEAVADGWNLVVEDAWALSQKPSESKPADSQEELEKQAADSQEELEKQPADSLEELEKQAAEVGVTVDRRWSDATLRQKIDEALAK